MPFLIVTRHCTLGVHLAQHINGRARKFHYIVVLHVRFEVGAGDVGCANVTVLVGVAGDRYHERVGGDGRRCRL